MPDDHGTPPPAAPSPSPADRAKKWAFDGLVIWRRQSRLVRWSAYIGGGLLAFLLLLIILLPVIVQPIIRRVLQSQIADNLNATLEIDDLSYHRFLGVSIGHARLTTPGPDGKALPVVELSGLDVSLARLPFGGPIVVDHCVINQPSVDLVRLPSGEFQIEKNFLKPTPPSNTKFTKLSDYLAVKHFELNQMIVRMTDLKAGGPVQQLLQLDVKADLAGSGLGTYDFHVALDHKPLADLSVDGSVDTDGYALNFKNLAISTVAPGEPDIGQLPEQAQTLIKQYGLTGQGVTITLSDGGSVAVDLAKGHWTAKGIAGEVKLTSTAATKLATGAIAFNFSGGGAIPSAGSPIGMGYLASLDPGTALNLQTDSANPLNLAAPQLAATVKNVAFAAKYVDRVLTIDKLAATVDGEIPAEADLGKLPGQFQAVCKQYGLAGQGVTITLAAGGSASVDLVKNHWAAKGVQGDLKLASRAQTKLATGDIQFSLSAGGPIPGAGEKLDPAYIVSMDADTAVDIHTDPANALNLATPRLPQPIKNATFAVKYADRTLTINNVAASYGAEPVKLDNISVLIRAKRLKLQNLNLAAAGGTVTIDSVDLNLTAPFDYTVNQVVYDKIDLRDVKDLAQINDPGGHISGTAHGTLHATGTLPPGASPLATVAGNGDFDVENGDFWDIPVLSQVAGKVSPNLGGSGRIGSAAGVFTLGGGKLNFSKLAVSSPLVGVQGTGDVGMIGDNQLDMSMVVAPLGDWKKAAEKVGVPGLGDILSKVQNATNSVSAKVLYSFHVTGPAASPKLEVVPAPVLTGDLQNLFGNMGKNGGLLDLLNPKK